MPKAPANGCREIGGRIISKLRKPRSRPLLLSVMTPIDERRYISGWRTSPSLRPSPRSFSPARMFVCNRDARLVNPRTRPHNFGHQFRLDAESVLLDGKA